MLTEGSRGRPMHRRNMDTIRRKGMAGKSKRAAGRKKKRRFLKDYEEEILEYYRQGKTVEEIAEKTGFTKSTLHKFLRENGCGAGDTSSGPGRGKKPSEENLTRAVPRKAETEVIRAGGKVYKDVTAQYAGW